MKLGDIAEIIIGITLSREQVDTGFCYSLFSLKSYENGTPFECIHTKREYQKELTRKGDLLFRLVSPNKLVRIYEDSLSNLLVSSQLCIIRPNVKLINPIFLQWYLDSCSGKEQLETFVSGTIIRKITIDSLRKINIPMISLESQEKISELIMNWQTEKQILNDMIMKKELLYNYMIEEKIKEESNEK